MPNRLSVRMAAAMLIAFLAAVPVAIVQAASVRTVTIKDGNLFSPTVKIIEVGDTIRWVYSDSTGSEHTVASSPHSPAQFGSSNNCPSLVGDDCLDQEGETFSFTFSSSGDFHYICTVHGDSMSGTIRVLAKPTRSSPTPTQTRTADPTQSSSPSPSGSPTGSPSPSGSVSPGVSVSPSPEVSNQPDEENGSDGGSGGAIAVAVLALAGLGGAGFAVYRRLVAPR